MLDSEESPLSTNLLWKEQIRSFYLKGKNMEKRSATSTLLPKKYNDNCKQPDDWSLNR